jgi:hypothetical protein
MESQKAWITFTKKSHKIKMRLSEYIVERKRIYFEAKSWLRERGLGGWVTEQPLEMMAG